MSYIVIHVDTYLDMLRARRSSVDAQLHWNCPDEIWGILESYIRHLVNTAPNSLKDMDVMSVVDNFLVNGEWGEVTELIDETPPEDWPKDWLAHEDWYARKVFDRDGWLSQDRQHAVLRWGFWPQAF